MESEQIKIFDEFENEIGVETRENIHKYGYWHKTFHCWFITKEEGKDYILLQIRSDQKKDYPNLLDITAAGHLLADESVDDGVREIKEELGIQVSFEELIPFGVIKYSVQEENFIDNELAHVFLYESKHSLEEYTLQRDEVSGVIKVEFSSFSELWQGKKTEVKIDGFEISHDGKRIAINKAVNKDAFVPHDISYYKKVITFISESISKIQL